MLSLDFVNQKEVSLIPNHTNHTNHTSLSVIKISDQMRDTIVNCFLYCVQILVLKPMYYVYRNGPSLHGFGFWYGQDDFTICSELSKAPYKHWEKNPSECQSLIDIHFHSFVSILFFVTYCYVLKLTIECIIRTCYKKCSDCKRNDKALVLKKRKKKKKCQH